MIIVTGGAGFIGSNIVKELNRRGHSDILVVDDLTDGTKFKNLADCEIADYCDKDDFLAQITAERERKFTAPIDAIFHLGACSSTTEWDGRFLLRNNYDYSKNLLEYCLQRGIAFIYASSAAVYGIGKSFSEDAQQEAPLNAYGYSKLLFDQYVRRRLPTAKSQIVGLRYFNVYGPRESHKANMASIAFHLNQQLSTLGVARLFAGSDGYADGEQQRDFIYVADVVDATLWCWENHAPSGIYNVGTGRSESFNAVAQAVIAWHKTGKIEYIPFPEQLRGHYQSFTQADISRLRAAGYAAPFKTVAEGVKEYLDWLHR